MPGTVGGRSGVRPAHYLADKPILAKFASQPAVEASIRKTIGNAYTDLSLYPQAQKQLEIALDLWQRRVQDKDRTGEFEIMNDLGTAYLDGASMRLPNSFSTGHSKGSGLPAAIGGLPWSA